MISMHKAVFAVWLIILFFLVYDVNINGLQADLEHKIDVGVSAECKESIKARSSKRIQITVSLQSESFSRSTVAEAFWYWSVDEDKTPRLFHKRLSGKQSVIIPGAQIEFVRHCGEDLTRNAQIELEMLNDTGSDFFHLKSVKNVNLPGKINRSEVIVPWRKQKSTLGYNSNNPYKLELKINMYTPQVIFGTLHYKYQG